MNKKILVITPTLAGGSWLSTENVVKNIGSKNVLVLTQGKVYHPISFFKYLNIPYPAYDKWGVITTKSPIISIIWNLPLLILSSLTILFSKQDVMITNGLILGFLLSPLAKIRKMKTIITYHSYIANRYKYEKNIMHFLSRFVDLIIANSKGSYKDIGNAVDLKKVVINEHYADDIFFKQSLVKKNPKFTILYVGRLDDDKLCYPLIDMANSLINQNKFNFMFAGVGKYESKIKSLEKSSTNIRYLGYITDRKKLAQLYKQTDIVWSFADTTYLALPAVEALASGTPIIIPNIQALGDDRDNNVRITTEVVPKKIGWLIDPYNLKPIIELINRIQKTGINISFRRRCRAYAAQKYTKKNLANTIKTILKLLQS